MHSINPLWVAFRFMYKVTHSSHDSVQLIIKQAFPSQQLFSADLRNKVEAGVNSLILVSNRLQLHLTPPKLVLSSLVSNAAFIDRINQNVQLLVFTACQSHTQTRAVPDNRLKFTTTCPWQLSTWPQQYVLLNTPVLIFFFFCSQPVWHTTAWSYHSDCAEEDGYR